MIDFIQEINTYKKKSIIYLIMIIVLSTLLVVSILLFIFLSNYKIQVIMSVSGSVVNSFLLILLIYIILGLYLPNKTLYRFFQMINKLKQEEIIANDVTLVGNYTIRRYVSLPKYYVNDREYYLLDESVALTNNNRIIIGGNYILGVKNEEKK